MNKELKEIMTGIKRSVSLLSSREKKSLAVATILILISGVLNNLPAVILGRLVDKIAGLSPIPFGLITPFLLLIIAIILIKEGLNVIWKYLIENIATQVDKEQTVTVIDRLLKTDIGGFLQKQAIGAIHGRVFRSIQGLILILKLTFREFAPLFFSALAAIAIAFYQKPPIATVMILVIPTGLFIIIKQVSSQKGIRVSLLRGKEQIDGKVVEMLGGIETIRTLNTVPQEVGKIEGIAERLRVIEIRHHIYMALFDAAKYLNESFFYILVVVLAIFFAANGIITKGDILVYSILFLSITSPLREIHRILDQAHENSIRVNDLYDLLHQPIDISYSAKKGPAADRQKTAVIIKDLRFTYPGKADIPLDGVNLTIETGQSIGIAGVSGGGKTTFIHILLKLIHGYSGEIILFGKNLKNISREEIAAKIAYVPQRPFIFSGTIKENIAYGVDHPAEAEIIAAAKKTHIYNEIMNDLGGLNGPVDENGANLSGGQRQRLAIARVLLQKPELIIFDEATSALDNTNEVIIQKNIEKEFRGKTMMTIAHRLTTLKDCDRIMVFDRGKIVQTGTFAELSAANGLFRTFLRQH